MLNPYQTGSDPANKTIFKPLYSGTTGMREIIHSMTAESVNHWGREMKYITRANAKYDYLFGEDSGGTFDGHYVLNFYIDGANSYGDTDMMSKFGIEVRDEALMTVAGKYFRDETGMKYPYEGDLIFDPLTRRVFEIKHVENEEIFYPLETLPQYVLKCELFKFSHERMRTGISEVDAVASGHREDGSALTQQNNDEINDALNDLNAVMHVVDNWDLGAGIDPDVDDTFVNWNSNNPFGE